MLTFDSFFKAIASQESGGSYGAIGPMTQWGHAYGKYQVLESNIGPWTATYYGKRLTPSQFLKNHDAQEAVARGVLKSYYNKWGPRGAAAAWYAGPGNHNMYNSTKPQPGGPSIKGYVDSVISKAGGYGSNIEGGAAGGALSRSSDKGSDGSPMSRNEAAETYGFVEALFDANPELKRKFDQAVKEGWTEAKFQAEIRDTKWWKKHNKAERDYLILRYGDPATAKQKEKEGYIRVRQLANQLGIVETDAMKKKLNDWAYKAYALGWSEEQLRYEIGKYISFSGDKMQGEAGEAADKLHAYAYSMGVKMSDGWYQDKARNIVRGVSTEQDYEDEIRRAAKATFPQWSKQIDSGKTVEDLASPYMQTMSQILELPAGSINLFDPTMKKALNYKNPTSGVNEVKPLWQFENELRSDPRWKKTQNAQDGMMRVAHQILTDFGVSY